MDYYRGKVKSVYEKEPYFKVSQILRGRKQKSCRFFFIVKLRQGSDKDRQARDGP